MLTSDKTDLLRDFFKGKPVLKAYLFGSFARNEESKESDIDILVDLDYKGGADFFGFIDMKNELSILLNSTVDLVSSNGLSKHIKPIIDAEKQVIYSKN